jgi:hypothetical protein
MTQPAKPKDAPQADHQKTTEQRIADLELQLATVRAGTPLGTTPENGAGVGTEIYDTWSQHDQELAAAGDHPDQD